jgi:hypothetical protein
LNIDPTKQLLIVGIRSGLVTVEYLQNIFFFVDLDEREPRYILLNLINKHWSLLILVLYDGILYARYKDPLGDWSTTASGKSIKFSEVVKTAAEANYGQLDWQINTNVDQTDGAACGPLCWANIESIATMIIEKEGVEFLLSGFLDFAFNKQLNVPAIRSQFLPFFSDWKDVAP